MPSPTEVKEAFNNRYEQNEKTELASADTSNGPSNFYEVFDDFVRVCGRQNDWTHSTFKKIAAVKNHLTNFRSELSFEFFDEEGLTEYVQYLREVSQMRNSTIGKQLSFLKWFLSWSFKQGMHSNNAYTFKTKLKDTQKKIIFLTWEELNRLREFKIPPTKQALERVHDVFSFNASRDCVILMFSTFAEATSKEITSK